MEPVTVALFVVVLGSYGATYYKLGRLEQKVNNLEAHIKCLNKKK